MKAQTLLCQVYKVKFLSKSRVYNSSTDKFCDLYAQAQSICSVTMVKLSNHYLKNCRRSCRDTNSTIMCDTWTNGHKDAQRDGHMTEHKTICPPLLRGGGMQIQKKTKTNKNLCTLQPGSFQIKSRYFFFHFYTSSEYSQHWFLWTNMKNKELLMSTHNICFCEKIRKLLIFFNWKYPFFISQKH